MRRSSKHQQQDTMDFSDFRGGVNFSDPAHAIAANELAKGMNVELDPETGRLQSRPRLGSPVVTLPAIIRKTWDHPENHFIYATAGTHLYLVDYDSYTDLGELSGLESPAFCYWDSKVYVASGGKLQVVAAHALTTLADSPECNMVFSRFGRLVISKDGQDYIRYSSVGDADSNEAWVEDSNNAMQAQDLEVAYKESGDIMTVVPLLTDLAVFRTFGIYRVISEYPDWSVVEVTKEYTAANAECAVQIGNTAVFLSTSGLMELSGVQGYGDVRQQVFAPKIREWLAKNIDPNTAWIRNLKSRKQLIIKPNALPLILVYHYLYGAATFWRFDAAITDIIEVENSLVVAQGASLYWMSREYQYDNESPVFAEAVGKKYQGFNDFLVKRLAAVVKNNHPGDLDISISGISFPVELTGDQLIYNDDELICNDDSLIWDDDQVEHGESNVIRVPYLQLSITSSTDFIFDQIRLETAVIGRG
ncbi:hypothetical protein SOV_22930 [Sporomusa ovata DSM 2662]|uniref:Uncharacterized protein n=1 Tax=Sporomusa ovata TaxID=2378 RepID=A0A0U1L386_9FIRM|nr:hypothetical protein [Sporomusa ovata]EQB25609.1 hypothetical protein SOV_4c02720 [Sporomusa ovata DSM 2662]CQR74167.1 hypothetical protein SpAn4DRAFT_0629 [Sporomusa ovata]